MSPRAEQIARQAKAVSLAQYGTGKFGPRCHVGRHILKVNGIETAQWDDFESAVAEISPTGLNVLYSAYN